MLVRLHGPQGDFVLAEGINILGRGRECQLCINDPRLSRNHARFVLTGSTVHVEDIGSRNGVLINGSRIVSPTLLATGDVIVCGPCRLTCALDITGTAKPPQAPVPLAPYKAPPTEAMIPVTESDTAPPQSNARLVDNKIAAAICTTRVNKPAVVAHEQADHQKSTPPAIAPISVALPAAPLDELPSIASLEKVLNDSTSLGNSTALAPPPHPDPPTARKRYEAALVDGVLIAISILCIAIPLAAFSYVIALHAANAIIVDELPRIIEISTPGAGWGALLASLTEPGTCARFADTVVQMHKMSNKTPFLILFIGGTLISLIALLILLFTTLAATVLHGGPYWHRRCSLEIVQLSNGAYPSWLRSAWRWLMVFLCWPLAPITIALQRRSIHDLLSGCAVRRRPY